LVLRKLRIKLETGNVTPGYQAALDVVLKRFPKGLFQRIIDAKYNESERKLASAATALEICMSKWNTAGNDWIGNAIDKECADASQAHEMVAMAKWILR